MSAGTYATAPTEYAVILFEGFQALDAFGPLDILNLLSREPGRTISLSILAATRDLVSTFAPDAKQTIGQYVQPTHSFDDAPSNIEVLIIPGGQGTRSAEIIQPAVDFLRAKFPKLRFLLTVCTGAAVAAKAGVLGHKRVTTNKLAFDWVVSQDYDGSVQWVRHARWVNDGNIWTSAGVSAGMDMMYAFVAAQYGEDVAARIAWMAEYNRQKDPENDPFSYE